MHKEVIVPAGPVAGFPGVVRAGPLLFVSGCDGHRDPATGRIDPELYAQAERQCENAYGRIGRLLRAAGASLDDVVRLDHFTSSQEWLARRQSVRGRLFGKPAPLASTGIAAKMEGLNMVTAAAIAIAPPATKRVRVDGTRYGMANISSAVEGGPFLFLSGIRGTFDPRNGSRIAEEGDTSFAEQTRVCYEVITSILGECGATARNVLRLECYHRDRHRTRQDERIRREVLGDVACPAVQVALPLSARGEVEITALAALPHFEVETVEPTPEGPGVARAGGFVLVGECRGIGRDLSPECLRLVADPVAQTERALDILEASLARCGSTLADLVRVEVYVRDIYDATAVLAGVRERLGDKGPSIVVIGAELGDALEVKISAIAVTAVG